MVKRTAFSMIELIFAIVVIALSVLSLPMITQVNQSGSENSLKASEAIFEAYVKAVEVTDENFSSVASVAKTSVIEGNAESLSGLKYDNKYKVSVTSSGFGDGSAVSSDIKKVEVTIYDEDGKEITKLTTFKFNM